MQTKPKIFLDTSALKYAAERLIRGYRIPTTFRWGDSDVTIPIGRWYEVYPNEKLPLRRRLETTLLPLVAWLASQNRVELLCQTEARIEFWGVRKTDDPRGIFYGAPITWIRPPIIYGRIIAGWFPGLEIHDGTQWRFPTTRDHQFDFLSKLQHPRFLQLQKATGAYQGAHKKNRNQLLDAFHIWCAEAGGANFFLTLDHSLLRHIAGHKTYPPRIPCVSPRQLITALEQGGVLSWKDLFTYLPVYVRQLRHPRTTHPLEGLVEMSHQLDKVERRSKWRRWFGTG